MDNGRKMVGSSSSSSSSSSTVSHTVYTQNNVTKVLHDITKHTRWLASLINSSTC